MNAVQCNFKFELLKKADIQTFKSIGKTTNGKIKW